MNQRKPIEISAPLALLMITVAFLLAGAIFAACWPRVEDHPGGDGSPAPARHISAADASGLAASDDIP